MALLWCANNTWLVHTCPLSRRTSASGSFIWCLHNTFSPIFTYDALFWSFHGICWQQQQHRISWALMHYFRLGCWNVNLIASCFHELYSYMHWGGTFMQHVKIIKHRQWVRSEPLAGWGLTQNERRWGGRKRKKTENASEDMFETHIAVFKQCLQRDREEEQKTCIALGIITQWLCTWTKQTRKKERKSRLHFQNTKSLGRESESGAEKISRWRKNRKRAGTLKIAEREGK